MRSNGLLRVRGLASSGRYGAGYGYANTADLAFRCDVAPNGTVYDVDIHHRY
jgi:hypothetical protein